MHIAQTTKEGGRMEGIKKRNGQQQLSWDRRGGENEAAIIRYR
jgi:hypothetical protein